MILITLSKLLNIGTLTKLPVSTVLVLLSLVLCTLISLDANAQTPGAFFGGLNVGIFLVIFQQASHAVLARISFLTAVSITLLTQANALNSLFMLEWVLVLAEITYYFYKKEKHLLLSFLAENSAVKSQLHNKPSTDEHMNKHEAAPRNE